MMALNSHGQSIHVAAVVPNGTSLAQPLMLEEDQHAFPPQHRGRQSLGHGYRIPSDVVSPGSIAASIFDAEGEIEDEEEEADDEFKEAFEECCILDSSGSETLVARGVGGSSVLVEDEAMDDIDE